MGEIKIGILYISLHNLLIRKLGNQRVISRKELFQHIGKHYLVPKKLRPILLKEMCIRCLIKEMNRDTYEVLESEFDLERDANKFYQQMGIF